MKPLKPSAYESLSMVYVARGKGTRDSRGLRGGRGTCNSASSWDGCNDASSDVSRGDWHEREKLQNEDCLKEAGAL